MRYSTVLIIIRSDKSSSNMQNNEHAYKNGYPQNLEYSKEEIFLSVLNPVRPLYCIIENISFHFLVNKNHRLKSFKKKKRQY